MSDLVLSTYYLVNFSNNIRVLSSDKTFIFLIYKMQQKYKHVQQAPHRGFDIDKCFGFFVSLTLLTANDFNEYFLTLTANNSFRN